MNLKWILLSVIIVPSLGGMGFEGKNDQQKNKTFLTITTAQLFEGLKMRDSDLIDDALKKDANINAKDFAGIIPTAYAIINNLPYIAKKLLERPDIQVKDWRHPQTKEDLVALANQWGQSHLINDINNAIRREEDSSTRNRHIETHRVVSACKNWNIELFKAAKNGDIELAKDALRNGAKINEVNNEGYTPLIKAILNQKEEVAILLINQPNIDLNAWIHPVTGAGLVDFAAQFKMIKLGAAILNKLDREQRSLENSLPDEPETKEEAIEVKRGFSDKGREFFQIGRSPARYDLNKHISNASSPLAGSSKWRETPPEYLVRLSLIEEATIAIISGDKGILIDILKQGITPMDITAENITLLEVAKNSSNKEIIEVLEKYEEKEEKTDKQDLEKANKNASGKILDKLTDQILHTIDTRNPGELENLLEGCNIQKVGEEVNRKKKISLLLYALKYSPTRGIIKVLIDKKVNINGIDANGWTPLMHAAVNNRQEIVELLLDADANVELTTPAKLTAYDLAKTNKREDIANLIQVFIASKKS